METIQICGIVRLPHMDVQRHTVYRKGALSWVPANHVTYVHHFFQIHSGCETIKKKWGAALSVLM